MTRGGRGEQSRCGQRGVGWVGLVVTVRLIILSGWEASGGIGAEVTWPDSGGCAGSQRRKRVEAAKWVRWWNPSRRPDPVRVKVGWF